MNRRERDIGERMSAEWWAEMASFAWSLRYDCDTLLSCSHEMEAMAREHGSQAALECVAGGHPCCGARAVAALHRIVDAVSGKPAQESQVLAEEIPWWRDRAYEVDDMIEEEE